MQSFNLYMCETPEPGSDENISELVDRFLLAVSQSCRRDLSEAKPKMQLNVGRVSLAMTREKGQVWPAADLG